MISNELKVGVAVLVSLVILVGGIIWGKGYRLSSNRVPIYVQFNSVGGLEAGANVLANGVVKGRVKEIDFRDGSIMVGAAIDKEVKIYSDYTVVIEAPTVMAGNVLSIYTGSVPPLADTESPLVGQDAMGMAEMLNRVQNFAGKVEESLGHLNALLINMNKLVGDTANQANVAGLLAEATATARQTNQLLADNQQQIEESLDKLDAILTNTKSISETADARLATTIDGVDSAMTALTTVAGDMRGFLKLMESEEGTMGKLLHDDELYIRLNETLAEVDSLSERMRKKGLPLKLKFF